MRRKFIEAELHCRKPGRTALELIGQLYGVEREAPSRLAMGDEIEVMLPHTLVAR